MEGNPNNFDTLAFARQIGNIVNISASRINVDKPYEDEDVKGGVRINLRISPFPPNTVNAGENFLGIFIESFVMILWKFHMKARIIELWYSEKCLTFVNLTFQFLWKITSKFTENSSYVQLLPAELMTCWVGLYKTIRHPLTLQIWMYITSHLRYPLIQG